MVPSTLCGDLDPVVVTYLMRREGLTNEQTERLLCKESGWLGISGVSNDLREVEAAAVAGDGQARTAIATFAYRARKYVGAYAAADSSWIMAGLGAADE